MSGDDYVVSGQLKAAYDLGRFEERVEVDPLLRTLWLEFQGHVPTGPCYAAMCRLLSYIEETERCRNVANGIAPEPLPEKPVLCLDFDGVLHSYTSGWKGADVIPDVPVPGAINWLKDAILTFRVAIFSARSHQEGGIPAMRDWLLRHGLAPSDLDEIDFPTVKPAAFVTIDDRAIQFSGVFPPPETLLAFKPWNKKGV